MSEKKSVLKEKLKSNQSELKEILENIKDVVSEEKETLFQVDNYKVIQLKKKDLVKTGKDNQSSALSEKKLRDLIKTIVNEELKHLLPNTGSKKDVKDGPTSGRNELKIKDLEKLKKKELIDLCRRKKINIGAKYTKAEILKELELKQI